jgi:IS5 family transposase
VLEERGLLMRQGTIVDATIIAAPPSTKNKQKSRDPEMHQTKKGNQWHFGMKAHIGVDVASGVVHTVTGTAANEADINQMAAVLHGREEAVFADAGYTGADKRPEHAEREVSWNIAIKRSIIKALPKRLRDLAEPVERGAVTGARLGRAPVSYRQKPVPTSQAALPRLGQEHGAAAHPVCACQPGDRQESPARSSARLMIP